MFRPAVPQPWPVAVGRKLPSDSRWPLGQEGQESVHKSPFSLLRLHVELNAAALAVDAFHRSSERAGCSAVSAPLAGRNCREWPSVWTWRTSEIWRDVLPEDASLIRESRQARSEPNSHWEQPLVSVHFSDGKTDTNSSLEMPDELGLTRKGNPKLRIAVTTKRRKREPQIAYRQSGCCLTNKAAVRMPP
jgi:hypothetical protein